MRFSTIVLAAVSACMATATTTITQTSTHYVTLMTCNPTYTACPYRTHSTSTPVAVTTSEAPTTSAYQTPVVTPVETPAKKVSYYAAGNATTPAGPTAVGTEVGTPSGAGTSGGQSGSGSGSAKVPASGANGLVAQGGFVGAAALAAAAAVALL